MKPGMRVYGAIVSRTLNNIVAYANQIYDESKDKFQSEINSGLQTSIDNIGTELNNKIAQEIDDRLDGDQVLQDAIDLLNANSSTQGSVQYWIKQAIDAVIADAPEAFDTLKEIADWIAQDEHGTAALINRVAANEEAIAAINRAISELETTLSQTDRRLSDAISTANSEIDQLQSDVAADVQDLQTFKTTVAQNEQTLTTEIINTKQSINNTQADLNQFKTDIRTEVESDISTAVANSKAREQEIWTDVARVDGRVTIVSNKVTEVDNTVKGITDANGNIKYTEALQSVIDTGISNNTAFNNISARWAVLDENQQVLEWMAAGFKSQVNPSTSFASVYATGKQETSDAISTLNTTIAGLGNTYVAKANLSTEVNTIVKEGLNVNSYSEVALQSDVNSAESRMSSKYDTLNGTVGTLSSNVASISTKANSNEAKISAITTTDGSGTLFLNESKVDSAMYKLLANTSSSAYSGVSGIADTKIAALDVTSKINGAISSLREEVSEDYVAKANLSTEVESAIKTGLNIQSYSEIALDSDVSSAEARMASQYSTLDTDVRGISTTLAGVSTKADANEAKVNAITTTDSSSTTVLSQSALNSAMLLLLGQGGSQTKTTIQSLAYEEAGSYFATIDISTIVHNAVEDEISQAGVASKSYVQEQLTSAETTIYSYLKDSNDNIISSSSIQNTANSNAAKLAALATWNGNTPTGYIYTSGLVTETTYNTQYAGLLSSISTLDGAVVKKASVIASINDSTESQVTISADKINVGGITIASSQVTGIDSLVADAISTTSLNADNITAGTLLSERIALGTSEDGGLVTYLNNILDDKGNIFIGDHAFNYASVNGNGIIELQSRGPLSPQTGYSWDDVLTISAYDGINYETKSGTAFELRPTGNVTAKSFIKNGFDDSYVLLAGGGTKALSEITGSGSSSGGTVTSVATGTGLTGGTITGSGTISIASDYINKINNGDTAYSWGCHSNYGYATQQWVGQQGYATQSWVQQQGYSTSSGSSGNYLPLSGGDLSGNVRIVKGDTVLTTISSEYNSDENASYFSITDIGNANKHYYTIGNFSDNDQLTVQGKLLAARDSTFDGRLNINDIRGNGGYGRIFVNGRGINIDCTDLVGSQLLYLNGGLEIDGITIMNDDLTVNGTCYATTYDNQSDIRTKNVVGNVELSLTSIANAPLFKFTWKEGKDTQTQHIGTSAQYWQEVTPELVHTKDDEMGTLTMQYDILALSSAITLAKEVVELKSKIKELEKRS